MNLKWSIHVKQKKLQYSLKTRLNMVESNIQYILDHAK